VPSTSEICGTAENSIRISAIVAYDVQALERCCSPRPEVTSTYAVRTFGRRRRNFRKRGPRVVAILSIVETSKLVDGLKYRCATIWLRYFPDCLTSRSTGWLNSRQPRGRRQKLIAKMLVTLREPRSHILQGVRHGKNENPVLSDQSG